ncbi:MAG: aminotransferase class IV [Planctomycetes bacterium]|nr:aminotransferase class IV [Planctomycetota bacterium]
MIEKVFLNSELIENEKAKVSVTDSGFLYGAGLFETMRSYDGIVFSLEDHLDRLFSSAEKLSIKNSYEKSYVKEAIYKTLKANELTDARIRLTLTSGPMSDPDSPATLLITAAKIQPYPDEYYKNGVMVILSPFRQNPDDPTCGHKTTSYFSRMLGLQMAHQKRAAEALWFTPDNQLAEGCVSNVFLVKEATLYTPPLTTPVLAGIARKAVCQIAAENSVKLVEQKLSIDDVLTADEVFLTNVIMKIMPVNSVEKHTIANGKIGAITKKMMQYFDEFVKSQCGKNK